MSDLWRMARARSATFDAHALAYDRYRPSYPAGLFDDIMAYGKLQPGMAVVEAGAGTGIATGPLADRGLRVTAIEASPAMAAVAEEKLGSRVRIVVGRFEDWPPTEQVQLVLACNAWHWVEPLAGIELAAKLLPPGGLLALVWTEVVSWGEEPFEDRLTQEFGSLWPKRLEPVVGSVRPVEEDPRFANVDVRHHRFERTLDAQTYVAVTRTYGGAHSADRDRTIQRIIDEDLGGTVTKVEDAVLHLARRR
jgi:SAM-dependent methyltransferase